MAVLMEPLRAKMRRIVEALRDVEYQSRGFTTEEAVTMCGQLRAAANLVETAVVDRDDENARNLIGDAVIIAGKALEAMNKIVF